MKFFGRKRELEIIKSAISRPSCFVVLTGRRRIGKTRLIREALKKTEHIELFIPRKRLTLVLESIKKSIQVQTGFSPSFNSFKEIFEYLFRVIKKPIFIDELSNLDYVDPGAFSELQAVVDKEKDNWGIRLVVDGSYVGVMKKLFIDKKEPLFGRATDLIDLLPLPLMDSIQMSMETDFGFCDALEAYSILGGVPRYIELLSQFKNFQDLKSRIFSPGSIFLPEGENVLIQEFGGSWETYFSILEVISDGKLGPSNIANQLGMPIQMIPKYLENLMRLQLIGRKRPVLGKASHVRYQIKDPFYEFWFKVCYPKLEQYRDGSLKVPPELISSVLGKSMERVVINLCSQLIKLPFVPDEIGSWWNRIGHEIDVIIYSKKAKSLLAGEVKWSSKQVSLSQVEQLLENVKRIDWYNDKRKEYLFIVSKAGFTKGAKELMKIKNILGLDLLDLEKIILKKRRVKWLVM